MHEKIEQEMRLDDPKHEMASRRAVSFSPFSSSSSFSFLAMRRLQKTISFAKRSISVMQGAETPALWWRATSGTGLRMRRDTPDLSLRKMLDQKLVRIAQDSEVHAGSHSLRDR